MCLQPSKYLNGTAIRTERDRLYALLDLIALRKRLSGVRDEVRSLIGQESRLAETIARFERGK